ncbi:MAG: response regulator [Candidatus Gastranaerophilales bacterium]|nr:response regulator [Candidatus Gastranaerophilales bacterium]
MTKKLVIIDDSSTQLNILKTLFVNKGWEVCGVQSAKIGYEIIFDFAPDLIITDAIMPLMGGFQLVKQIRENPIISKIPVIVYSVLSETNAKFYINEELSEYFLKKDDNHDEILTLAQKIVEKFPLEKEYKDEILRAGLQNYKTHQEETPQEETEEIIEIQEEPTQSIKKNEIDIQEFEKNIKNLSDFSFGDEKILSGLYSILYNVFNYDLAVLNVHSFENEEKKSYFDIKNIILSPILKNTILNKYQSKIGVMYKKYAPNLKTAVNESEFLSKIELDFEYKNEKIANFVCYSYEKLKWENIEKIDSIKEILHAFFKTRHIQRGTQTNKKEDFGSKYIQLFNKFSGIKNTQDAFFSIIQISNYSDLTIDLPSQDIDILNSRISEKIIEYLEKDEQVYKNDEDEYNIVIFAKDFKQAKHRLEYLAKKIKEISYNTNYVDVFIAGASCNIDSNFNIIEAQKNARTILEEAPHEENVVIYNE